MPPPLRRSSSASAASTEAYRRHSLRSHSDSYRNVYPVSCSASSETSSIFSHVSSSSSATSTSSLHSAIQREVGCDATCSNRSTHRSSRSKHSSSISVILCFPETGRTKVVLPRTLARPQPKSISTAALAAVNEDLENVPLPYILQSLKDIGPRMMAALARTSAPTPVSLPRELVVRIAPDPGADPAIDTFPTHLLAVYARSKEDVALAREGIVPRRKVTLFPTHGVMLAAHCAHLPPLPPGGKGSMRQSGSDPHELLHEGHIPDPGSDGETRGNDVEARDGKPQDAWVSNTENSQPDAYRSPPPGTHLDVQRDIDNSLNGSQHSFELPSSHTLTLPVVPLCIPDPKMFPVLQAYLYTKRADHLLGALVPNPHLIPTAAPPSMPSPTSTPTPSLPTSPQLESLGPPSSPASDPDLTPRPSPAPSTPTQMSTLLPALVPDAATFSAQLAAVHTSQTLVRAALRTHGVWANAAALGVFDERLWLTIDFAWRVLLGAFEQHPTLVGSESSYLDGGEDTATGADNVMHTDAPDGRVAHDGT